MNRHYNLISRGNNRFSLRDRFSEQVLPKMGAVRSLLTPQRSQAVEAPHLCNAIIRLMARGWESKSVEAQQEEAAGRNTHENPRLTRQGAARLREKENLRLALQSVVQQIQRSHNARHRAMLEQAQADLERKIQELGV
jgi:hypothetical protein